MIAQCNTDQLEFQDLGFRKVIGKFDGGMLSTDSGGLLLREIDTRFKIIDRFENCFIDERDLSKVEHSVHQLLAQRIFGICLGYEDLNDHEELRKDPLFALICGRRDIEGKNRKQEGNKGIPLAGKSTLNRLETATKDGEENSRYKKIFYDEEAIDDFMLETFLENFNKGEIPKEIILDLDTTDDLIHGTQEGRFFHYHYDDYCYLPLYIFCEDFLVSVKLRTSDEDAGKGALLDIKRIIPKIKKHWPKTRIMLRGDSGFCRDAIMAWCEENKVDFVFGLPPNSRLNGYIEDIAEKVKKSYERTKKKKKRYIEFNYKTNRSWARERRVIGKAEYNELGKNNRFIVTTLKKYKFSKRKLYEDVYCARGDMENRIKEQKLDLFSDRTSSHTMKANQLRVYFAAIAYVIMNLLRVHGLSETKFSNIQCGSIRLKILKIAARIKISFRRVIISFTDSYPYKDQFLHILEKIRLQT